MQDRRDGREKRRRLDKDQPRREMSPWTPPRPTSGSVIASTSEERIGHLEQLVDELKMRNNLLEQRSFQFAFGSEKFNCVPRFEPGIPNLTAVIKQMAASSGWNEATKISYMQSRLDGLAKRWYDSLPKYDYGWEEWKRKILQAFPDHRDFATSLRTMLAKKKDETESWSQYYFSKMELIRACELSEKQAVSCVIDGISNDIIQTGARAGRYETPEALYSSFLSTLVAQSTEGQREQQTLQKVRPTFRDYKSRREERNFRTGTSFPRYKPKYYNCHEVGHLASACSRPKMECSKCKRLGHISINCRKNAEKIAGNVTCKIVSDDNQAYYTPCLLNGQRFLGYVDTGCGGVIIRQDVADNLRLEIEKTSVVVYGYNNTEIKVLGTVNVTLQVDLAKAEVQALVVENCVQAYPVLIGQEFLNKDKILVARKDEIRILEDSQGALPGLDEIPMRKIAIIADEDVEVQPKSMGYVPVTNRQEYDGEVYIEGQVKNLPLREHLIVRCVSRAQEGCVGVYNVSDLPVVYRKGQIVARGVICEGSIIHHDDESKRSQVLSVTCPVNRKLFTFDDINPLVSPLLAEDVKTRLLDLLNEYRDCFATTTGELGKCKEVEMEINLKNDEPVTYRPYRLSYAERQHTRDIINDLLKNDIIQESNSPYASPILLVKKKDGDTRLCVDFRKLNAKTIKDKHPLPHIEEHLDRLKGCEYFTSLDLAAGYHQIAMAEESVPKTGFVTPDGHYEYVRMPFGLVNAPAVFQRAIIKVLGPLRFNVAMAYMDDVLIPSKDIDEGLSFLKQVLNVFRESNLTIKLTKCLFFQQKLEYLGHEISAQGIKPGTRKTIAIEQFPRPKTVHEIRQFIGLASYFRKYIANFAVIASPLTQLTRKDVPFVWHEEQEAAFNLLKNKLTSRPVLAIYDAEAHTEVHTDASKKGFGGILLQKQKDNSLRPVKFFSRKTSKEEQLAVVSSLLHFRVYLIGIKFTVITDCNALRTALTKRDLIPRIGRWWLQLSEFDFSVEYRSGTSMPHVDALSRNPVLNDVQNLDRIPVLTVNVVEDDWILSAQLNDDRCKYVLEVLTRSPVDAEERDLHKQFKIRQHRLYRQTENGLRWVVPKLARRQILRYYHDEMGHFALDKTLEIISKSYWFPGMRRYVTKYIANCLNCLYNKKPTGKKPGLLHPIPKNSTPFDTIHIDHLGPFVSSTKKNNYLLVITEAFTKFILLKAVQSTKVGPLLCFLTTVIDMFGVPKRIISDRGSCFTCKKFVDFCNELGIKSVLNATATPRANGQVERMNSTILHSLASSLEEGEDKWDRNVSKIQFAYNSTINKTTGKSPYELMMGYRPRNKGDAFVTNELDADVTVKAGSSDIQEIRNDANVRIVTEQAKAKQRFDAKRRVAPKYDVGQQVVILKNVGPNDGKSKKLLPKYDGPFIIKEVLQHDRYAIEDIPGTTRANKFYRGVCSVDKIKPYPNVTADDDIDDESSVSGDVEKFD
jgi:transposase InsO family protein